MPEYEDEKYLIIPLSERYNQGKTPDDPEAALTRIRTVMGDEIECLL